MKDPASAVRDGVVARLRNLLLALDRQDRLETAQSFAGWLAGQDSPEQLAEHSRELLLRALRVAGDPINFQILSRLDPLEPVDIGDLIHETRLNRVALSERVHDMVQVGLAVRELINDQVRGTDLGAGLEAFVAGVARDAGSKLAKTLTGKRADRDRPGVLP